MDKTNPTPKELEAVVMRQVERYNARDLEGFLATYHEDAVIAKPKEGVIIARGKDAMRAGFAKVFAANPGLHCDVPGCVVQGDFVAISERITGLSAEGPREALAVYEVKDGLITWVGFF